MDWRMSTGSPVCGFMRRVSKRPLPLPRHSTFTAGSRSSGRCMIHWVTSGTLRCSAARAFSAVFVSVPAAVVGKPCSSGCVHRFSSFLKNDSVPVRKMANSSQPSTSPAQVCSHDMAWRKPSRSLGALVGVLALACAGRALSVVGAVLMPQPPASAAPWPWRPSRRRVPACPARRPSWCVHKTPRPPRRRRQARPAWWR